MASSRTPGDAAAAPAPPSTQPLGARVRGQHNFAKITGESTVMKDLFALVESVAASDANILIQGENGAGKEVIADALHRNSNRAAGPFIKINCSAIPTDLIEEGASAQEFTIPPHRTLAEIEKMAILQTLRRTDWNWQEAAQILGLHRPTLYNKMKRHGIQGQRAAPRTDGAEARQGSAGLRPGRPRERSS